MKLKELKTQQSLLLEIYEKIRHRPDTLCNFVGGFDILKDTRICYRRYATLYFVFVVDSNESELGILDLIQVFVEALDSIFVNVCELDIIFRPLEVGLILGEIISGGIVLETNLQDILSHVAVKKMNHRS